MIDLTADRGTQVVASHSSMRTYPFSTEIHYTNKYNGGVQIAKVKYDEFGASVRTSPTIAPVLYPDWPVSAACFI